MEGKKVGVFDHYYDQIEVAVLKITDGKLKVGDQIKVYDRGGNEVFEQEVTSMQIDGKEVNEVKKGDDLGIKVDQKVKEGYEAYKL